MKAQLYSINGEKKSEIALPGTFDSKIREDVALKAFLSMRFMAMQPYSHAPEAGKRHSASGTISQMRHAWGGHYGKGISRIPRKQMYRKGTQFFWVGAEITSARGGRRVHGPVLIKRPKKINKNEFLLALYSGLASTFNESFVSKRYSSLDKPMKSIVIESKLDNIKTKDLLNLVKKIFGSYEFIFKNKEVRSGKGKGRGRKYKSNAGILLVKGKDEKIQVKEIEVKSIDNVSILDLYPLGRLAIYTEKALKELEAKK